MEHLSTDDYIIFKVRKLPKKSDDYFIHRNNFIIRGSQ